MLDYFVKKQFDTQRLLSSEITEHQNLNRIHNTERN